MSRKLSRDEFVDRACSVHGDRYDYSKVKYEGLKQNVEIICQQHGSFFQSPAAHLSQKQGCPVCGRAKGDTNRVRNQEHFFNKLGADYTKVYDMSSAVYRGFYIPVSVGCSIHGKFSVKPCDMYKGVGCPKCSTSGFKMDKPASLYVLRSQDGVTKIGITNRRPKDRARKVTASSGKVHEVVLSFEFKDGRTARDVEAKLLNVLRKTYENPDEIYDGYTESFIDLKVDALTEQIEMIRGRQ